MDRDGGLGSSGRGAQTTASEDEETKGARGAMGRPALRKRMWFACARCSPHAKSELREVPLDLAAWGSPTMATGQPE